MAQAALNVAAQMASAGLMPRCAHASATMAGMLHVELAAGLKFEPSATATPPSMSWRAGAQRPAPC